MTSRTKITEVSIPELEILRTESADERIMQLFQKHKELAVFQMVKATHLNRNTLENALRRMTDAGQLTCRQVLVKRNSKSIWVNLYSLQR